MSMMTLADFELLRSDELRRIIDENIERDPLQVALDRHIPHASLVATQIKYLQRARHKLPQMYAARCIIPSLAFEQSSSEECAWRKPIEGGSVLDLTCGLGIDTLSLAKRFRRVVAVERNGVLAEIVRYNLSLLGVGNVSVVTASAEEYVAECCDHFDWVYIDPDRRSDTGRKLVRVEDCSPDVVALMPRLCEIASRIAVKLSPLFDCEEAFRVWSPAEVEVVSLGGECKEVNVYTHADKDVVRAVAIGCGECTFERAAMQMQPTAETFNDGDWRYLVMPDVALQKARVAVAAMSPYGSIWSNNGYLFCRERPAEGILGRVYAIDSIERYRPKELKRALRGLGVEISKRDTSLSVDGLRKALGVRAGGDVHLALTSIESENWVIRLKSLPLQRDEEKR